MSHDIHLHQRLRQRIDELPVLPTVVAGLMGLDRAQPDYFERVLELVEADPTFAARLLAAANSAASAPNVPITSVRSALARLGSSGARDLILAGAVSQVFVPNSSWEKSLWRHSLQVAGAMRTFAGHLEPAPLFEPDEAYLAGLLHDIGRLVFFAESPELLEELDEEQWDSPAELVAAERAICGLDHGTVGQLACDHWGLPHRIGAVAQRHHLPIDSVSDQWSVQLLELLTFADASMFRSAVPGASIDDVPPEVDSGLMKRKPATLQLDARQFRAVMGEVIADADVLCERLGIA